MKTRRESKRRISRLSCEPMSDDVHTVTSVCIDVNICDFVCCSSFDPVITLTVSVGLKSLILFCVYHRYNFYGLISLL